MFAYHVDSMLVKNSQFYLVTNRVVLNSHLPLHVSPALRSDLCAPQFVRVYLHQSDASTRLFDFAFRKLLSLKQLRSRAFEVSPCR